MARSKAFPLLFLLGFVSLSASPTIATSNADLLLVLNLMWPGTYCSGGLFPECCFPTTGPPALDFFVQGFETYDNTTGGLVTNCSTDCRFSVNRLRNLITDLYAYWTDVSCPSNNGRDQWEKVWCSYGTCSNLTQLQYFNQSLLLRAQVDVLSTLKDQGIVPSETEQYNLGDIEDALNATLGSSAVVECKWNLVEYQLYKIHICVSSDGKSIISCPVQESITCGSKVKFPPFSLDLLNRDTANPIKMPVARDVAM